VCSSDLPIEPAPIEKARAEPAPVERQPVQALHEVQDRVPRPDEALEERLHAFDREWAATRIAIDDELAAAPDDDARIAILLRALRDHPTAQGWRWDLYEHYRACGEVEAAQRTLAEGAALDVPGFLEELALFAPRAVRRNDAFRLAQRGNELAAIEVLLAHGDTDEATAFFARALERAETRPLFRPAVLRVALRALASGAPKLAERVATVVHERPELFTRAEGSQRLELYLRELLDASPYLEDDAREVVAQQLVEERDVLSPFRKRDRQAALRAYDTLRMHAPALATVFGGQLRKRGATSASSPTSTTTTSRTSPWRWIAVAIFIGAQVVRMFGASESAGPHTVPPSVARQLREPAPPRREVPRPPDPALRDRSLGPGADAPMTTTAEWICDDLPSVCAHARRVSSAALRRDCSAAASEASSLEQRCLGTSVETLCAELAVLATHECAREEAP
jgi:hypothetical protein